MGVCKQNKTHISLEEFAEKYLINSIAELYDTNNNFCCKVLLSLFLDIIHPFYYSIMEETTGNRKNLCGYYMVVKYVPKKDELVNIIKEFGFAQLSEDEKSEYKTTKLYMTQDSNLYELLEGQYVFVNDVVVDKEEK